MTSPSKSNKKSATQKSPVSIGSLPVNLLVPTIVEPVAIIASPEPAPGLPIMPEGFVSDTGFLR